jgi:hypothetical protein
LCSFLQEESGVKSVSTTSDSWSTTIQQFLYADEILVCLGCGLDDRQGELYTITFFTSEVMWERFQRENKKKPWQPVKYTDEMVFYQQHDEDNLVLDGEGSAFPPFVVTKRFVSLRDVCEEGMSPRYAVEVRPLIIFLFDVLSRLC